MNKLSEIFDVEVFNEVPNGVVTASNTVIPERDTALQSDYEITRSNLHSLLEQGQEALLSAIEVAKSSENPRAFEVVGGLMKHLSDINHQLMDLHTKKQKLDPVKETTTNITNNSVFVGSTSDLSRMIENLKKGT